MLRTIITHIKDGYRVSIEGVESVELACHLVRVARESVRNTRVIPVRRYANRIVLRQTPKRIYGE
jgi:hypothetical protein